MAVVALLLVVLQGQLVKQRTGEMGWEQEKRWDWNEAETRRLVVSRDPVYKCCKGRLANSQWYCSRTKEHNNRLICLQSL